MKIVLTSGIFPPDIGGPATFIPELAEYLVAKRNEVSVLFLKSDQYLNQKFNFEVQPIHKSNTRILRMIFTSYKIFRSLVCADVLFSNGLYLESVIPIKLLRKRALAKIVGDPLWERDRNSGKTTLSLDDYQLARKNLKNFLLRKLYVLTFNSYETIICPSEDLINIVKDWGVKSKLVYIPNGVNFQEKVEVSKDFDLIYVGRLVKWKNIDKLIQVAKQLELKICIIGDGPERISLESQAVQIGCDSIFMGELNKKEIIMHLNQSKIFVLISQYEGLSYSLLEAMSLGLPVIVSNAKGNVSVVEDNVSGKIVQLEELGGLKACIKGVIDNAELSKTLGCGARERVKKYFSAEVQLSKIYTFIQGVE